LNITKVTGGAAIYVLFCRSTEEIFALFISMAFAVDALKDVVAGNIIVLKYIFK